MSAEAVLAQAIGTSISVSLLIAVILLIRKPVARRFGAEAAYLLWLAPVLRIVMPDIPAAPPISGPSFENVGLNVSVAGEPAGTVATPSLSMHLAPALLALWAAGAIAFLALQLLRQRRFLARVAAGASAPSPTLAAEAFVAAEKAGLRTPPRLRIAADETGPLVCGLFNPVVILPATFEDGYSPDERRLALAHEFAHIRRGDLPAAFAAIAFRAIQWPNPLAHAAFARFRADQEAACDSAVLRRQKDRDGIVHAYGSAMLKAAAGAVASPAASLSMSHQLKERLMLMKTETKTSPRRARLLAAAMVLVGITASAGYSQAGERKEERTVSSSAISVIKVDGDESIEYGGVKNAKKIEIRHEDGVKTVKVYGDDGRVLLEKAYSPAEASPPDAIVIRDKDGKTRTVDLAVAPTPPTPPAAPVPPLPPEASKSDCEARGGTYAENEKSEGAGKRTVIKTCIIAQAAGDPKAKADALRAAIAQTEGDATLPADQRAAMVAKLREQLAAAEKEGAGR